MERKITVQLYSLRKEAEKDYVSMINRVAEIGFENVEPAGFPGASPVEAAKLFKDLGLSAPSIHGQLPLGDDKHRIIEEAQMFGTKYIYTGCPPDYPTSFMTVDGIKRCAQQFNKAAEFAAQYGIQVGIHNHSLEMVEIEGRPAYEYFLDATSEDVLWEADIYWVHIGGRSIPEFIERIGARGKVLHFKDGAVPDDFQDAGYKNGFWIGESDFQPAGEGVIDMAGASAAAKYAEYIAVELDAYNGDMMGAVEKSYKHLTSQGIAKGRI